MRIVTVVGARPQIIKAAAFSNSLIGYSSIEEIIVHTGQHYDQNMSDVFFEELGLPLPSYNLGVGSGSHAYQTGKMMIGLEKLVDELSPGIIVVYGDTNSTLAGSIVAAKTHTPLAHIEAGLRSFNKMMPEEINRIVTDRLSDILFCPTEASMQNLRNEGCSEDSMHLVGDVMYDSCLYFGNLSMEKSNITQDLGIVPGEYVLATVHRAENTDDEVVLGNIISTLDELSKRIRVVFPLHPRTKSRVVGLSHGITFIDPVGYLDMIELEKNSKAIITDSGGVQKEAYFHRVPCITIRTETEWVELVESGWNTLIDPNNPIELRRGIFSAVENPSTGRMDKEMYGGGRASENIRDEIIRWMEISC